MRDRVRHSEEKREIEKDKVSEREREREGEEGKRELADRLLKDNIEGWG